MFSLLRSTKENKFFNINPFSWVFRNSLTIRLTQTKQAAIWSAIIALSFICGFMCLDPIVAIIIIGALVLAGIFFTYPIAAVFSGLIVAAGVMLKFTPIGTSTRTQFIGGSLVLSGYFVSELRRLISSRGIALDKWINTSYIWPTVLLSIYAFLQSIYSIAILHNQVIEVIYEAFPHFMWLSIIFMSANLTSKAVFIQRLRTFFLFTMIIASCVIIQALSGYQLMVGSRVEDLNTLNTVSRGVTRSITDAIHFIILMLLLLPAFWTGRIIPRFILLSSAPIFVGAILFQFGRGIWLTTLLAFLVFVVLAFPIKRAIAGGLLLLMISCASLLVIQNVAPRVFTAVADRISSVSYELKAGKSIGWRKWENDYAFKSISHNFLLGISPGNHYRSVVDRGTFSAQTRFVHNGYLYFFLKYGTLGALMLFMVFANIFKDIYNSLLNRKKGTSCRFVSSACVGFVIAFLIVNITQPDLMSLLGVISICLVASIMHNSFYFDQVDLVVSG